MRILISIVKIISDYKIKTKNENDKILITAFSKIHEIFNDENHVIFSHFSDKILINQNSIFSSTNMIIVRKTIFVLDVIF